jgi:hypothetical protein
MGDNDRCRIYLTQGEKMRTVNQLTLQQFEELLERVVERHPVSCRASQIVAKSLIMTAGNFQGSV